MMDAILNRMTLRNVGKSYRKLVKCGMWLVYDALLLAPVVGLVWVAVHFLRKCW